MGLKPIAKDLRNFRDIGIKECRFHSAQDERVCEHCADLDNKIFEVTELIKQMSYRDGLFRQCKNKIDGCRCYLEPIFQEDNHRPLEAKKILSLSLVMKVLLTIGIVLFLWHTCG